MMENKKRKELLEAYEDLRVTDVRDGMDTLMLHSFGSMTPNIRPVNPPPIRAFGIAKTVRYLPFEGEIPYIEPDKYMRWANKYYRRVCSYKWMGDIQEGDFIVIDASGVDSGLMGSENSLIGIRLGAHGYVSNGGVRDTDEIIIQKVPFWSAIISQSMVQGRLQYDTCDIPVSVGGVTVNPGDIVVADNDGVIVVPQKIALKVAYYANEEHERDKKSRRSIYKGLGMEPDDTV
ncbi:MAG: RraA family protein [Promethearchaeota archaeon]|nr:MAG: RraA family protein [Candidatus Lokiarchaeota archaeon]